MIKDDLKSLMKTNYLQYASYVILDRAIPDAIDGLKPVQRRILHTLFKMDDGKLHKVANIVGQTMAYHPHGDAPINEALINIANKGFLIDRQGNFGNLLTGDPAAASRYIEAKLSALAKETLFNPDITDTMPSYDGRNQEPVRLPVKIPLLLMQGAEGIAVGMSTKILPHNFIELLEAEIAYLEKRDYTLYPDFPTGGVMDISEYDKGRGKVRVRAKLDLVDSKTIVIREICPSTTTESLINSIDEAAKRGKLKIESMSDYTASHVEIEIKLARGQHAQDMLDALYAFTECEVSINTQAICIKDNLPWETDVDSILELHADFLKNALKEELVLEQDCLLEKIFLKTLERIFIENRLYKKIEEITSYDLIHDTIEESLKPFHHLLYRLPNKDDRERLLNIPIRRISRFDLNKNKEEIAAYEERLDAVKKFLANLTRYTVNYIKSLIKKYQPFFARKTIIKDLKTVDIRSVSKQKLQIGVDYQTGFVGEKVKTGQIINCSNLDKIVVFFSNGEFKVINPIEKEYLPPKGSKIVFAGVADKKTIVRVLYYDPKTFYLYAKRFIVSQFILNKLYNYFDPGMELQIITDRADGSTVIDFKPKAKQKLKQTSYNLDDVAVKGVAAKGVRIATKEIKKVSAPIFDENSSTEDKK